MGAIHEVLKQRKTTRHIKVNISAASCEMRTRQVDACVVVYVCFVGNMCVGVQKQQEHKNNNNIKNPEYQQTLLYAHTHTPTPVLSTNGNQVSRSRVNDVINKTKRK